MEEGRGQPLVGTLTWKMTRRATTSTFFIGFPAGDKGGDITAWRRQCSIIKEIGGTGVGAPLGTFIPGSRHHIC